MTVKTGKTGKTGQAGKSGQVSFLTEYLTEYIKLVNESVIGNITILVSQYEHINRMIRITVIPLKNILTI